MIQYDITDTSTGNSLAGGNFNLGIPLPSDSRFGLIAASSANAHFDSLEVDLD